MLGYQEGSSLGGAPVLQHLQNVRMIQGHTYLDFAVEVVLSLRVLQPLQDVELRVGLARSPHDKSEALPAFGQIVDPLPLRWKITHVAGTPLGHYTVRFNLLSETVSALALFFAVGVSVRVAPGAG